VLGAGGVTLFFLSPSRAPAASGAGEGPMLSVRGRF
jgi:hypothetical protein